MRSGMGCQQDPDDFLVFGQPSLGEDEIREVVGCLRSGWLGRGPRVCRFERDFAAYKGVAEAVALQSCSAALLLALRAAGIGPGDEVITTPLTYCATINAIIHAGATPVLADIDPHSLNVSAARVRERVTPRTRALIPVHFAGRPCDMDALMEIARQHKLTVVEDCAHAIETEYHGSKAGTIGDFGCFSFYPTKNVTCGDGGMALARVPEHREMMRILASQGMTLDAWKRFSNSGSAHYAVVAAGFKYNLTDVEAAIGIHQLARVEENWKKREAIWHSYREALREFPVTLPAVPEERTRHAFHLFQILIDEARCGIDRDSFLQQMKERGIGCAIHYRSATEEPFYQQTFGWTEDNCPEALRTGRQTVSLPVSAAYTHRETGRVLEAVRQVFETRPAAAARGAGS